MRILVLSQYFWPENFRINDLAAELAERGHEVTVLTGIPNYPAGRVDDRFRADPDAFSRYGKVRIVRVPMLPRGKGRLRLALNYLSHALSASVIGPWRLRGQAFDCIFTFQVSPGTVGLPAVILRRLKRARLLFWVQDLWPESLSAVGAIRSRTLLAAVGRFMEWVYRHTDLLLVQSSAFIPQLRQRVPTALPIRYLPNWADTHAPRQAVSGARQDSDTFDIYYLGNLGEAQDFPAVLAAIEHLKGEKVCWHFVGDGSAAGWLKAEVAKRRLHDVVSLPGRFPAAEMPDFLAHADALLVSLKPDPLFALTIPSKVQTYLTSGVPILAMLDGEGARVVEEAQAGVTCAAGDARALAANVRHLRALPHEARMKMGACARAYYDRQFGFPGAVDRLETWLIEPDIPATP